MMSTEQIMEKFFEATSEIRELFEIDEEQAQLLYKLWISGATMGADEQLKLAKRDMRDYEDRVRRYLESLEVCYVPVVRSRY
jgi:hypothetical protein